MTDLENINAKIVQFLKATMTNTVAANANAILFTLPDTTRNTKAKFPAVAVNSGLEEVHEKFGQKTSESGFTFGSEDKIRITAFIFAKYGKGNAKTFGGNSISGSKLVSSIVSEFINAFKQKESTLQGLLPGSVILEVPTTIDNFATQEDGLSPSRTNPKLISHELTALIKVKDAWN